MSGAIYNALVVFGIVAVIAVFLVLSMYSVLYRKVAPNTALIVYGRGGMRVVTGNAAFVIPLYQHARLFPLELFTSAVAPKQELETSDGAAVRVEATALIRVRSDVKSILTAAEAFLGRTPDQREALLRPVVESALRGAASQLSTGQIVKEGDIVSETIRNATAATFSALGLELISCPITTVTIVRQVAAEG